MNIGRVANMINDTRKLQQALTDQALITCQKVQQETGIKVFEAECVAKAVQ